MLIQQELTQTVQSLLMELFKEHQFNQVEWEWLSQKIRSKLVCLKDHIKVLQLLEVPTCQPISGLTGVITKIKSQESTCHRENIYIAIQLIRQLENTG